MVILAVDLIFGARLGPLPSSNEKIDYYYARPVAENNVDGNTNRGPDFWSQSQSIATIHIS